MQITATTFPAAVDRYGFREAAIKATEVLNAAERNAYSIRRRGDAQTAAMIDEARYNLAMAMCDYAAANPIKVSA